MAKSKCSGQRQREADDQAKDRRDNCIPTEQSGMSAVPAPSATRTSALLAALFGRSSTDGVELLAAAKNTAAEPNNSAGRALRASVAKERLRSDTTGRTLVTTIVGSKCLTASWIEGGDNAAPGDNRKTRLSS